MTKDEIIQKASIMLSNTNLQEVEQNSKLVEDVGYRFWEPTRGGRDFILGFDGGYLESYISSTTPEEIIAAYKAGKRSELKA